MAKKATTSSPLSFGIEADHSRNCDLYIQSIPGCRLRSAIKASRTVTDARTGEKRIPTDQARHLGMFPETPGMELHVNPEECTYVIRDPLRDNKEMLDRIQKAINEQTPLRSSSALNGVETTEGKLDVHRMKTLVREMLWWIESGDARVIQGVVPDEEDINELPGDFLLNPGSRISNTQPRFEKDWDDWVSQLTQAGG